MKRGTSSSSLRCSCDADAVQGAKDASNASSAGPPRQHSPPLAATALGFLEVALKLIRLPVKGWGMGGCAARGAGGGGGGDPVSSR